jgi:hypothetical protein
MMDGSDNTISHYMRYLNDPGRMDGENWEIWLRMELTRSPW